LHLERDQEVGVDVEGPELHALREFPHVLRIARTGSSGVQLMALTTPSTLSPCDSSWKLVAKPLPITVLYFSSRAELLLLLGERLAVAHEGSGVWAWVKGAASSKADAAMARRIRLVMVDFREDVGQG